MTSFILHSETLVAKIDAEIAERGRQLATGMAADWADYCGRVAQIKGLQRALELLAEIDNTRTQQ